MSLIVAMSAGVSLAQQGRPGGPGGGRFFGGGFGGGMTLGGGLLALLRMDEVQAELKLNDDAKKQLTELGESLRSKMDTGGFANFRDMNDEERAKAMREMREKTQTVMNEAEDQIALILDPSQMDRLIGLLFQQSGPRSLTSSKTAAEALKITDDQKKQLTSVQEKMLEEMRANRPAGGPGGGGGAGRQFDPNAMRERMNEMNKATDEKLMAVLTAEQKNTMEKMKGEKFTFPEPRFGAFGGPGGPGGGQGRRPGGGRPDNN
jgi:hypothetical protein